VFNSLDFNPARPPNANILPFHAVAAHHTRGDNIGGTNMVMGTGLGNGGGVDNIAALLIDGNDDAIDGTICGAIVSGATTIDDDDDDDNETIDVVDDDDTK
jgi:hypothetical protein